MKRHSVWFAAGTLILALVALGASVYLDNHTVRTRTVEVAIGNLPESFDGFRILLISDLHGAEFGVRQRGLMRAIERAEPDAIALAGDFVDKARPSLTPALDMLHALPDDVPSAFVLGNSDLWSPPDPTGSCEFAIDAALAATCVDVGAGPLLITRAGTSLALCVPGYSECETAPLAVIEDADVVVALSHAQPETLDLKWACEDEARRAAGVYDPLDPNLIGEIPIETPGTVLVDFDLLLAGHTHGGQARVPILGALYAPGLGFGPPQERVRGLYEAHGRAQYVSAGLGAAPTEGFLAGYAGPGEMLVRWARPTLEAITSVRIFNPATIDVVVLRTKE